LDIIIIEGNFFVNSVEKNWYNNNNNGGGGGGGGDNDSSGCSRGIKHEIEIWRWKSPKKGLKLMAWNYPNDCNINWWSLCMILIDNLTYMEISIIKLTLAVWVLIIIVWEDCRRRGQNRA